MAKMIKNRKCVRCGQPNVYLWTLDNTQTAAVTYLCKEHSEPLLEIMEIAGDLAPDEQVPLPVREEEPLPPYRRSRRDVPMEPLLNWTPPPPLPAPPADEVAAS